MASGFWRGGGLLFAAGRARRSRSTISAFDGGVFGEGAEGVRLLFTAGRARRSRSTFSAFVGGIFGEGAEVQRARRGF